MKGPLEEDQGATTQEGVPPEPLGPATARVRERVTAAVVVLLAVAPSVLWPGDTPWIFDEPAEVGIALKANQEQRLAAHGLGGNFYVRYGPLPMHIYQAMLLVSHDPRHLVLMRAALFSLGIALSLLWLGRTLNLGRWFAAAVVLAPYLWLNNRILWAASFVIPITLLAVAAYASYLKTRGRFALVVAFWGAVAPAFVHPQSAPLSAVIVGHMLVFHWRGMLRAAPGLLLVAGVMAALNWEYIQYLEYEVRGMLSWCVERGHPSSTSRVAALFGPLLSGTLIGGGEFGDMAGPLGGPAWVAAGLRWASSLGIPLVWIGAGAAVWSVRRPADAKVTMMRLALACLGLQMIYFAVFRVPPAPHYFFGTFGMNVLLAWQGAEALAKVRLREAAVALYGIGVAGITLGTLAQVRRHGWPRGWASPTLNEQVALVRELNRYENTEAYTDVTAYQMEPANAIVYLRALYPAPAGAKRRAERLVIRYREGGELDGRIELVEMEGGELGAGLKRIAVR